MGEGDVTDSVIVELALQARDQASAVLEGITKRLDGVRAATAATREALVGVTAGIGLAAAGGIALAVEQAAAYQNSLRVVQNNAALTDSAVAKLGVTIEQTAVGTTSSANAMAAALGPVAGEIERVTGRTLDAKTATTLLTSAQDLHESANISLASSLKHLTDTLLIYHMGIDQSARISNDFFQAQAQLGIGADTLATMLQRLQPRIAGSGASLEQVLGIVREITPAVGTGPRALMQVGTVLQAMMTPTAASTKLLTALGISVTDATGKFRGLPVVLGELKSAYDRLPASVAAGSKEITKNMLLQSLWGRQANIAKILVEGGASAIAANTAALAKNGTAADAAARLVKTLDGQFAILKGEIATAATAIGMSLVPALETIIGPIMPIMDTVVRWTIANPKLAASILIVVAALGGFEAMTKIIEPLLGRLGVQMGALLGPIGLAALAVGGFVLVLQNAPGVMQGFQNLLHQLSLAFGPILDALGNVGNAIVGLLHGDGSFDSLNAAIGRLVSTIGTQLATFGPAVVNQLESIGHMIVLWVAAQVPVILAELALWAQAFVNWVGPMIPQAITALTRLATGILDWVASTVPVITNALLAWAGAFADWILPQIPGAVAQLGSYLAAILNWVVGYGLPRLLAVMGQLGTALVDWIVPRIPEVVAALAQVGLAIVAWVASEAPTLIVAFAALAAQAISGFVGWLIGHPGVAVEAIALIVGGQLVVTAVTAAATLLGTLWTAAFQLAAAALGRIAAFAKAVGETIILQAMEITGTGGVIGAAWSLAFRVATLAANALTSLGTAIAGVLARFLPGLITVASAEGLAVGEAEGAGMAAGLLGEGTVVAAAGSALGAAAGSAALAAAAPFVAGIAAMFAALTLPAMNPFHAPAARALNTRAGVLPATGYMSADRFSSIPNFSSLAQKYGGATYGSSGAGGVRTPSAGGIDSRYSRPTTVTTTRDEQLARGSAYAAYSSTHDEQLARIRRTTTQVASLAHTATGTAEDALKTLIASLASNAKKAAAHAGAGAAGAGISPATSAALKAAQANDALTKAQQQLALEQAKLSGKNPALLAAADGVTNAQHAVTIAEDKLKAAHEHLIAVEDAHYKSIAARTAAIDKAKTAEAAASQALQIAQIKLATAEDKEANTSSTTLARAQAQVAAAHTRLAAAETALAAAENARRVNMTTVARDEARVKAAQDALTKAQNNLTDITKQLGTTAAAALPTAGIGGGNLNGTPTDSTGRFLVPIGKTAEILPQGSYGGGLGGVGGAIAGVGGAGASYTAPQPVALVGMALGYLTNIDKSLTDLLSLNKSTTGPVSPGMLSPSNITLNAQIYLDGRILSGAISKMIFEEERTYAGPVNPLSPF